MPQYIVQSKQCLSYHILGSMLKCLRHTSKHFLHLFWLKWMGPFQIKLPFFKEITASKFKFQEEFLRYSCKWKVHNSTS